MASQSPLLSDLTYILHFECPEGANNKTSNRALFRFYDLPQEVDVYRKQDIRDMYTIIFDKSAKLLGPELGEVLINAAIAPLNRFYQHSPVCPLYTLLELTAIYCPLIGIAQASLLATVNICTNHYPEAFAPYTKQTLSLEKDLLGNTLPVAFSNQNIRVGGAMTRIIPKKIVNYELGVS